jgi:hypothetical protein
MGQLRTKRTVLLSTLVSGALAAGTLSGSPTANASCLSVFGLGNGNGCTSGLTTYAIAIGPGATADAATALFGGAFALGSDAHATMAASGFTLVGAVGNNANAATLGGLFGTAFQLGPGTASTLSGILSFALGISPDGTTANSVAASGPGNIAVQIGPGTAAIIGALNLALSAPGFESGASSAAAAGLGNIAVRFGAGTTTLASTLCVGLGIGSGSAVVSAGVGNFALDFLSRRGTASTTGVLTSAVNIFGVDNKVSSLGIISSAQNWFGVRNSVSVAGGLTGITLGLAANFFGSDNTTTAGAGPLAIVASIFDTGATVTQTKPGIKVSFLAKPPRAIAASRVTPAASRGTADSMTSTPADVSVGPTPAGPNPTASDIVHRRSAESAAASTGGKHRKVDGGKHRT